MELGLYALAPLAISSLHADGVLFLETTESRSSFSVMLSMTRGGTTLPPANTTLEIPEALGDLWQQVLTHEGPRTWTSQGKSSSPWSKILHSRPQGLLSLSRSRGAVTMTLLLIRDVGTFSDDDLRVGAFFGSHLDGALKVHQTLRQASAGIKIRESAIQTDHMATVGRLASGIAHEINNPLSYVLFNLEDLSETLPQLLEAIKILTKAVGLERAQSLVSADHLAKERTAELIEEVEDALEGSRTVREIVAHLGTFSHIDDGSSTQLSVGTAMDVAATMAHNSIKYTAKVVKDYSPCPPVVANQGKLAYVFLNLLLNALEAIEVGHLNDNEIRIRTWGDDDTVFVEVSDTGSGIQEALLPQIFDPFFTTKADSAAAGLGLSTCQSIITAYGGSITAANNSDRGARFTLRLPAAPATKASLP